MENMQERQLTLPKNIRQIGNPGDTYKIYVEDFVYTYVHQFLHEKKEEHTVLAAVLLGETRKENGKEYIFISGARKCDFKSSGEEDVQEDKTEKQQEFWNGVYQGIKEHFADLEILGWYINLEGCGLEVTPQLQQFFEATYSKGSRFLYYEDSAEHADAFFVQEQHSLHRLGGYAVYYERNQQMREFMISERERLRPGPAAPAEFSDMEREDVVSNYRTVMNKLNEKPKKKKLQPIVYIAGVAVLAVVSATGITQIGNYQNMRVLENTLQTLSGAVTGKPAKEQENADTPGSGQNQEETAQGAEIAQEDQSRTETGNPETGESQQPAAQQGTETQQETETPPAAETQQPAEASQKAEKTQETEKPQEAAADPSAKAAADSASGTKAANTEVKPEYYTVKKGDSLVSISRQFYRNDKMVDEICLLNKIENMDVIYEGQKLRLP